MDKYSSDQLLVLMVRYVGEKSDYYGQKQAAKKQDYLLDNYGDQTAIYKYITITHRQVGTVDNLLGRHTSICQASS
jgi:hypothetical protein